MRSIIIISCVLSMMACSTADKPDKNTEVAEEKPLFRKSLHEYSPFFQNIIGRDSSDFRGIKLGMSMGEVRAIEKAHHEETDSLTVRYDFEDGIDKNVEIEYRFSDDSLLQQMDMTIYFAEEAARDSLFDDLRVYFSEREHTKGVAANFYWEGQQAKVIVEKGGIPQFPEIAIRFQ